MESCHYDKNRRNKLAQKIKLSLSDNSVEFSRLENALLQTAASKTPV